MNDNVNGDDEKKRFWLANMPSWLWRFAAGLLLAGIAAWLCVPYAVAQRGGTGFGGEYGLILAAFILPFCIGRGSF